MAVEHYENFPVASWLCPARIRPAVVAIYWFARQADDLADEGQASASQRSEQLLAYRQALHAAALGRPNPGPYAAIFQPLAQAIQDFALPVQWLDDLLTAFLRDVAHTEQQAWHTSMQDLHDYARYSANPVGRLLLHLYGVHGEAAEAESDAICTALQLINFWQDLSVDIPRQRYYLPTALLAQHGLTPEAILRQEDSPASRAMVLACCAHARELMLAGRALPGRIGGRSGLELRLVMAGGLRILDHIARMKGATLHQRPKITWRDGPSLLYSAWRLPAQ